MAAEKQSTAGLVLCAISPCFAVYCIFLVSAFSPPYSAFPCAQLFWKRSPLAGSVPENICSACACPELNLKDCMENKKGQ